MVEKRKKVFKEVDGVTHVQYEGDDLWLKIEEDEQ